ncbi:MAG: IS66 family transposase [Deltaproteobacteria bacterium]|nr:IS66 family transposase [Deltaproteobacteria bacterium]
MGKNNRNTGPKDLKNRYAALSRENQNLRQQVEVLTNQLAEIQRMIFGRKSEKVSSDQLAMFAGDTAEVLPSVEDEDEDNASDIADPPPEPGKKKKYKSHPGRHPLSPNLERQDVHLHPDNLDCTCCGAQMKPAGVEISEKLASRPRFYVERINLHKYACRECEESIVRPDMPPAAIDKCLAKSEVLAGVIVAKYQDSLPLYRQEVMFRREGVTISRQTMCGWMSKCAFNLRPIVEHMGKEMLAGSVIQSDDTGLKYLESPGPAGQGYMWSYVGSDQAVVYDFTTDRSRAGPAAFLSGFSGTLQVDGYAGYNLAQETGGLVRAACWAHTRRKFEQSLQTEKARAAAVLLLIQKLYGVEREIRQNSPALTFEQIVFIRQRESLPVIKELKKYLLE